MGRKYTFEDSAVIADLRFWGYYKGRQYAADGYSPESTLVALLSGVGHRPQHRVLIPDMPHRAWEINGRIMAFHERLIEPLVGRYCLPRYSEADDGEIAEALGYSVRTFYRRLGEARRAYRRSVFGPDLSEIRALAVGA